MSAVADLQRWSTNLPGKGGSFLRRFCLSKGCCFRISVQRLSCLVHHTQSTSPSMYVWETWAGQAHSRAHHPLYKVCPAPSQGLHRVKGLLLWLSQQSTARHFLKLKLQRCIGCIEECSSILVLSDNNALQILTLIVPSPAKKWASQKPANITIFEQCMGNYRVWIKDMETLLRPVGATRSRVVTYRSTVGSLKMRGCWGCWYVLVKLWLWRKSVFYSFLALGIPLYRSINSREFAERAFKIQR